MKLNQLVKPIFAMLLAVMAIHPVLASGHKPADNYITEDGVYKKLKHELNTVYFDFDKSQLKDNTKTTLDQHAKFLLANSTYQILVEGHADERGSVEYNLALGERRALAIKDYLVNKGVSANQIYTVSYGKNKLAFLGKDSLSHAKNRRGVIVY